VATETTATTWDDRLHEAAEKLAQNLRDGYTKGYEYQLVDDLLKDLTEELADAELGPLLFEHMSDAIVGVTCLLDGAGDGYLVAEKVAKQVQSEIRREGSVLTALKELAVRKIVHEAKYLNRTHQRGVEVSNSTAIALAKVRAHAIREAYMAISEDETNHDAEHFGTELCLGCQWRARLAEYAWKVEHEADEEVSR
jgi:hypothetical protein